MKIALLFPGYHEKMSGIAKELSDAHRVIQEHIEEASHVLNLNMAKIGTAASWADLPMDQMHMALFTTSCALYALLVEHGIKPEIIAGHNTGLYAAFCAAKAVSFADGLYLLSKYTMVCQKEQPLTIIHARVMHVERDLLEKLCLDASTTEHQIMIAIYYMHDHHMVIGHEPALNALVNLLEHHAQIESVSSFYGWHSSLADALADEYMPYVEKITVNEPQSLIVAETDGRLISSSVDVRDLAVALLNKPLRFYRILDVLALHDIIVIGGPGQFLKALINTIYPDKKVVTLQKQADIDELRTLLS